MVNGKRMKTKTVATPQEAERLLDLMRGFRPGAEGFTLGNAFDLVRTSLRAKQRSPATAHYYEEQFKVILQRWPAETVLAKIDAPALERWRDLRLQDDEVEPATVAKNLAAMGRLFRLAMRKRAETGIHENPLENVDRPESEPERFRHLPIGAIRSMLERMRAWPTDAAGGDPQAPRETDLVELMVLTGIRRSELARLARTDADVFRGVLYVQGKRRRRELPLSDDLKVLVGRLLDAAGDGDFLVPGADLKARCQYITSLFVRWSRRLRMHVTPHILRVSFCTWHVDHGTPLQQLQALVGHEKVEMTLHYYRGRTDAAKAGLAAMGRELGSGEPEADGEAQGQA